MDFASYKLAGFDGFILIHGALHMAGFTKHANEAYKYKNHSLPFEARADLRGINH